MTYSLRRWLLVITCGDSGKELRLVLALSFTKRCKNYPDPPCPKCTLSLQTLPLLPNGNTTQTMPKSKTGSALVCSAQITGKLGLALAALLLLVAMSNAVAIFTFRCHSNGKALAGSVEALELLRVRNCIVHVLHIAFQQSSNEPFQKEARDCYPCFFSSKPLLEWLASDSGGQSFSFISSWPLVETPLAALAM